MAAITGALRSGGICQSPAPGRRGPRAAATPRALAARASTAPAGGATSAAPLPPQNQTQPQQASRHEDAAPVPRRALLSAAAAAAAALAAAPPPRAAADEAPAGPAAAPAAPAPAGAPAKVFVAGATGQTGRRVVQQLRAAGIQVRAGVRDTRKAQSLGFAFDQGIELVACDVVKQSADELAAAIGDATAVICCTGYTGLNPAGFGQVDETGTENLVDAAKRAGVGQVVLLTSLLTNAPGVGQADNPNYKFLNLFGGVLDHKLAGERYLRGSGLGWTIVRPGGLASAAPEEVGNLIVSGEDTLFGLDTDPGRQISRDTVAEVLVAALLDPAARGRVVEIVASPSAPALPRERWFDV
ncbi:hypothetical protein Rsub_11103 [Raphidocelis subcapitata]|uniref:NAD(P)-binding domain-containing protein n=1 Tax=Raphidocelis subcapitata TaxID=307507 RepID=A0A2V0PF34_9CHLO|nr:hypothetical protein Rsub_11103 [Raphidocelis subcapitata]|eukprot:GBF98458.1 hypothetical protein Rsub_11103 [Raphidocelis subcapitata]